MPHTLGSAPGRHPGWRGPILDTGPSNLPGGTEGASLHPTPGPDPPLSGRQQEAQQAQAPTALPQERLFPSGCLSHILSFSVSPPLLPPHPVELLGKSSVRPPAAPPVLGPPVCLPQLRAIGRSLSRPRRSEEGGRPSEGGARGTVPWGPGGPWPGMSPRPLLGQSARPRGVGAGRVGGTGPGCPAPTGPARSPAAFSHPGSPSPHHSLASLCLSLAASSCRCCCPCASLPELSGSPH